MILKIKHIIGSKSYQLCYALIKSLFYLHTNPIYPPNVSLVFLYIISVWILLMSA